MVVKWPENPAAEHDFESCACASTDVYCNDCEEASIHERIAAWRSHGERGLSSDSIAVTTLSGGATAPYHPPIDSGDLRRCLLLLEEVPEGYERGVLVLAQYSDDWRALAEIWDLLSQTLRWELGGDLELRGWSVTPQTSFAMYHAQGSYIGSEESLTTTILVEHGNHRVVRRPFPVQFPLDMPEGVGGCADTYFLRTYAGWICGACGDEISWKVGTLIGCRSEGCSCLECVPYVCREHQSHDTGCIHCDECGECGKKGEECEDSGCTWKCNHVCTCECYLSDDYCSWSCQACEVNGCQCADDSNAGGECKDMFCGGNKLYVNGYEVAVYRMEKEENGDSLPTSGHGAPANWDGAVDSCAAGRD